MIRVSRAETAERALALSQLFQHLEPHERAASVEDVLQAEAHGDLSLEGLLVAHLRAQAVASLLYLRQPDESVSLILPQLNPGNPDAQHAHACLMAELVAQVDQIGATYTQCLLDRSETTAATLLKNHGFRCVTQLEFRGRELSGKLPEPVQELQATSFASRQHREDFVAVIEATYENSLDCVALKGRRSAEQALANHRSAGVFDPELWTLYHNGQTWVGVLLANRHPAQQAAEVVYMGVVAGHRGQGLGRDVLLTAMRQLSTAGVERIFLAVDSGNQYATLVYDQLGFIPTSSKDVWLRFCSQQ